MKDSILINITFDAKQMHLACLNHNNNGEKKPRQGNAMC